MVIRPLEQNDIGEVASLMALGEPYIRVRGQSDYWLYATLFSSTCLVASDGAGDLVGALLAFRSQDCPDDIYIQDIMIHPDHRRAGIARQLLETVKNRAIAWGCRRIYLTSEPENVAAHATWTKLGYINKTSSIVISGVFVTPSFKGPGKDRAVYELHLIPLRT